jgi:hypothetical protein
MRWVLGVILISAACIDAFVRPNAGLIARRRMWLSIG